MKGCTQTLTVDSNEVLARLLAEQAGDAQASLEEMFAHFRTRLITFFKSRRSWSPVDHADETIGRIACRIAEGVVIRDLRSYAQQTARNVWSEAWRQAQAEGRSTTHTPVGQDAVPTNPDLERSVDYCMSLLSAEERYIIEEYYKGDKHQKIVQRQALAQRLGISVEVLRLRAFRIRSKLRRCITQQREHLPLQEEQ